jgi:hypothetical protein
MFYSFFLQRVYTFQITVLNVIKYFGERKSNLVLCYVGQLVNMNNKTGVARVKALFTGIW